MGIIPKMAAALGWPVAYLIDEEKPYPPSLAEDRVEAILNGLDPGRIRLLEAMQDDDIARHLLGALDQYEAIARKISGQGK